MTDKQIRNRIVEKLLRNRVIGNHKIRVDTAVNRYLPSHEQGRGKELVREMIRDLDGPIEGYGSRDNIRLTSKEDAVEFLKSNDGNVPFGFD
jgi:hypothetical protein